MKILLLGPQGSGKGTIGSMISQETGIPLVSVGQILRNIPNEHPWRNSIQEQMKKGLLVEQSMVAQLLKDELSKEKYTSGFVLDGWYRSMKDIEAYEIDFDIAFLLQISPETTVKRISSRRTCPKCGKIYNTVTPSEKPKIEGKCDKCITDLVQRDDDTEEAILKRLHIFQTETKEVSDLLRDRGILKEIDGEGPPNEVYSLIKPYL